MHIHITPRHLKLTAAIHGYVADKVGHLEKYVDNILAAHVVLWKDEQKKQSGSFIVKVHLALPGPDIHAEESGTDLYAAVDMVIDKIMQQLRHRKTRLKDGRVKASRRAKAETQRKAFLKG